MLLLARCRRIPAAVMLLPYVAVARRWQPHGGQKRRTRPQGQRSTPPSTS